MDVGSSWSPSDLLAGLLVGQLERFDFIQKRRHAIWARYNEALSSWSDRSGVRLPGDLADQTHAAHLFHIRYTTSDERSRAIELLRDEGIRAVFHYQPLHTSEVGRRLNPRPPSLPVTEDAADTLLRLPLFVSLTDDEIDHIIEVVKRTA